MSKKPKQWAVCTVEFHFPVTKRGVAALDEFENWVEQFEFPSDVGVSLSTYIVTKGLPGGTREKRP